MSMLRNTYLKKYNKRSLPRVGDTHVALSFVSCHPLVVSYIPGSHLRQVLIELVSYNSYFGFLNVIFLYFRLFIMLCCITSLLRVGSSRSLRDKPCELKNCLFIQICWGHVSHNASVPGVNW